MNSCREEGGVSLWNILLDTLQIPEDFSSTSEADNVKRRTGQQTHWQEKSKVLIHWVWEWFAFQLINNQNSKLMPQWEETEPLQNSQALNSDGSHLNSIHQLTIYMVWDVFLNFPEPQFSAIEGRLLWLLLVIIMSVKSLPAYKQLLRATGDKPK